jgi:hypothetical protein
MVSSFREFSYPVSAATPETAYCDKLTAFANWSDLKRHEWL